MLLLLLLLLLLLMMMMMMMMMIEMMSVMSQDEENEDCYCVTGWVVSQACHVNHNNKYRKKILPGHGTKIPEVDEAWHV